MKMVDTPEVFQTLKNFAPANTAAWACMDDDGERFIYILLSATSFWQYDTWKNVFNQLANPTGTFGAGTCMRFTKMVGSQTNGVVKGSIYAIVSSGTGAPVFQRYDIGTNVWATLNVTGFAATFGTDGNILFPTPAVNNYENNYHSWVLRTITTTAQANAWATTISVSALPEALPSGAVLNFGTASVPIYAVLTATAALNATSITVAALNAIVPSWAQALWYGNMYVIWNNGTQMYRFNLGAAAWTTNSANSGNPSLPALTGAAWAWLWFRWVPGITGYENKLIIIRWGATNAIYTYDLVANTMATLTYYPATETFSTGTSSWVATNQTTGKPDRLLISSSNFHNSNCRILELKMPSMRMEPVSSLTIYPSSTAVVGDKMTVLKSPDWLNALYHLLHTSNALIEDLSLDILK